MASSLPSLLEHADDVVLPLLAPFLGPRERRSLADVCPRGGSFRRQWLAQSTQLLLPSRRPAAERFTSALGAKPLVRRVAVEDAALLSGLLADFPALTHVVVTGGRDNRTATAFPPVRRSTSSTDSGRRSTPVARPVALANTLPRTVQSLDLLRALLLDVSALTELPRLTELKLPTLHALADQALAAAVLGRLVSLTELTLWQPAFRDFTFLRGLQRLRSLTIAGTWTVINLELVRGMASLSSLELKMCSVTNVCALGGAAGAPLPLETLLLPGVTIVNRPSNVTGPVTFNESLAALDNIGAGFTDVLAASLTALSVGMTDDLDWSPLLELPMLKCLDQQGDCDSPTDQWDVLVRLSALRELRSPVYLGEDDPPLTLVETLEVQSDNDMTAPKLKNWPCLTSLKWYGQCDADLVRRLPVTLRHLELDLGHDIDLKRLRRLVRLESLRVHCTRARFLFRRQGRRDQVSNEEDYSFLSSLVALERLELDGEPFRDLTVLRPLQRLRHLDVADTLVDDVAPLCELCALEFVDLSDTQASDDAVRRLGDHPTLLRVRHPDGSDRLAPFTEDDAAPPRTLAPLYCALSMQSIQ